MHSLFAVENPLMDIIAHVDYGFLERFEKKPGTMHLVEYAEVAALVAELPIYRTTPGGSAANTARGFAWLAGPEGAQLREADLGHARLPAAGVPQPVFNGAIGEDARGEEFSDRIAASGVHGALVRKKTPTGTSVILVTPDGERTMNTFLGASREFGPEDLDVPRLSDSRILYLTGYLWDTENQRRAAARAVAVAREGGHGTPWHSGGHGTPWHSGGHGTPWHSGGHGTPWHSGGHGTPWHSGGHGTPWHSGGHGTLVAFDLADPFAVRRYAEQFRAWIPGKVDIVFGNRDEIALLTGASCDEDCVTEALSLAPLVVMKTGERGCLVGQNGKYEQVPGFPVKLVDTTGAGDAFAAGFLYGTLAGADPLTSARLANRLASRVVGVEGCSYI